MLAKLLVVEETVLVAAADREAVLEAVLRCVALRDIEGDGVDV